MTDDQNDLRSPSVEQFLKTVYVLQQQVDPVPTTLIARSLEIKAPSVTDMIKRLSATDDKNPQSPLPLLEYKSYHGIRLTESGKKIALEVIRHHRLLELYLVRALGYSWDEVHEEADRLEHVISEKFEARIAAALGNPELDPHGDPIPALDGTIANRDLRLLSDLEIGQQGRVSRIADQTPEVLRYLSDIGLTPGAGLSLTQRAPLNDTVSVCVDSNQQPQTLSIQVARKILVTAT